MTENEALKVEPGGYWDGKTPCWEMRECIGALCEACPAYLDQSCPCWEAENTPCSRLLSEHTCFACAVFMKYAPAPGGRSTPR